MSDDLDNPQGETDTFRDRVRRSIRSWQSSRFPDSIFIWIPKNAGTSLFTLLRRNGLIKLKSRESVKRYFRNSGRVTFGHMAVKPLVADGLVSPQFVENAFKFVVTRDPYARAVSLYQYLHEPLLSKQPEPPSFLAFLDLLAAGRYAKIGPYNSRGLSQCNPQTEWLRDLPPDKIYKIEEPDELIADLSARWMIPPSRIPHENRSSAAPDLKLSRKERSLIEQIYADDFRLLGYPLR